jgi:hypothetical protein
MLRAYELFRVHRKGNLCRPYQLHNTTQEWTASYAACTYLPIVVVHYPHCNKHCFCCVVRQVLAMLTVWGVADMRKLEEVRIIHTEEVYQ